MAALAGDGRVFGVDASMGMLGVLRGEGRGSAARASTQALPFADGTFDATWCVAVLHHLSSPDAVAATIREMVRVTRPEGWVVVWDHNPLNPYWPVVMARVPQDAGTERLVPAKEIEAALAVAGASEWRVERRGLVPDFAPAWAMGLFRVVEALIECAPLLNRLAAHNVVVARVGDTGGRGNKTGAGA
jgi:SAM-dependent methyltransferase